MAFFRLVPVEEARLRMLTPRQRRQARYQRYVSSLTVYPEPTAGRLELQEGERPISVRAQLRAAAKALGLQLEIRRRGNVLVFWPAVELGG